MEQIDQNENKPAKRPVFLLVLAILSFITIGIGLLANVIAILSGPLSADEMETSIAQGMESMKPLYEGGMNELADTMEMIFRMENYINSNFYPHMLITILSLVIGLVGVIFMMKGKKNGFHLYIIYNLMSATAIYVSVPVSEVPNFITITNLLFAGLFIFLYSRNLHWMK